MDIRTRADILHDVNILSISMSPAHAILANALFFAKWEANVDPSVLQVIYHWLELNLVSFKHDVHSILLLGYSTFQESVDRNSAVQVDPWSLCKLRY